MMENEMDPVAANLPIKADERIDDSSWRDIDIFLPVDDPSQFEQIQILFRVHKNNTETNYIYFDCGHKAGIGKCKYKIRWRKSDGMVQSKGKHGHEKFKELKWKKCRECQFECVSNATMRNHYLQNHNDKPYRHCPKCAVTFDDPNELRGHIQRMHSYKEGDLAELHQRLNVIIREWEQAQQQQRMNQEQTASTSNFTIGGGWSNNQYQNAAQNNNFQQQSNCIPSTSNAMPPETPYFLKSTNWSEENDGKLEENNIDEE